MTFHRQTARSERVEKRGSDAGTAMDTDESVLEALREALREVVMYLRFERDEKRVLTRVPEPDVEFSVLAVWVSMSTFWSPSSLSSSSTKPPGPGPVATRRIRGDTGEA